MRRGRDEVAVRHRVGMQPRGDEPREVGHVAEQQSADLVRDLAEAVRLDGARIGRAAADDQLGAVLLRQRENIVVVHDHRLARDAVVDDVVELPREVDLEPVRQVPPMLKLEGEHRVAGVQRGRIDGHVRLGSRMRLHVRVLGSEQLFGAVDRGLLDLVDHLAAAVVPSAGITLGVLVRRNAPDGLEDAWPGEVLGGDQLDLAALPLELAAEELGDIRIDLGEPRASQMLECFLSDRHHQDATAPPGRGRGPRRPARRPRAGSSAQAR